MARVLMTTRVREEQNTLSKTNYSSEPFFFGWVDTGGDGKNKTGETEL